MTVLSSVTEEDAKYLILFHELSKHLTKDNWYNVLNELVIVKSEDVWYKHDERLSSLKREKIYEERILYKQF